MEQDHRPVPQGLRPVLTKAGNDYPKGRFTCQTGLGQSKVLPCVFGDAGAGTTVVLFGDSHAAQWLPALDRAGRRASWRIVQLTKSACPSLTAIVRPQFRYDRGVTCRNWRRNAIAWLNRHPPAVIVISNHSQWTLLDSNGRQVPNNRRLDARRNALLRTLRALPSTARAVVLSDTPKNTGDPIGCLRRHRRDISACTLRRSAALFSRARKAERAAAIAGGAATRNLNDLICTYDPCPLIQGRTLMWRDHGHLTATFSKRLWPSMRDRLRSAAPAELGAKAAHR